MPRCWFTRLFHIKHFEHINSSKQQHNIAYEPFLIIFFVFFFIRIVNSISYGNTWNPSLLSIYRYSSYPLLFKRLNKIKITIHEVIQNETRAHAIYRYVNTIIETKTLFFCRFVLCIFLLLKMCRNDVIFGEKNGKHSTESKRRRTTSIQYFSSHWTIDNWCLY